MYFREGCDVGDIEQLVIAAKDVGLDGKLVREYLRSETGCAETIRDIELGLSIGVAGVPCYRLGGMFLLLGAHLADTMVQYIERTKDALSGKFRNLRLRPPTCDEVVI